MSKESISTHEYWMTHALALAKQGAATVSPNPMVGAVLVDEKNQMISEGYHEQYGEAHAEVHAIGKIPPGTKLEQATLYVTLEPCNHTGNTPPCTKAILDAGIKTVIIGCMDPAKHGQGSGATFLKEHGVNVLGPILESECLYLNRRFITAHLKKRPYIILKWAETADGYLARENGDSKWISSEASRTLVHQWRTEEDVIMVGTNTAAIDNPQLTARHVQGPNPVRLVLDRTLRLPPSLALLDGSTPTIVVNELKEGDTQNVSYWKTNFDSTLLSEISQRLIESKHLSLFVEGGAQLLSQFITENLWDEIRVFKGEKVFDTGIKAPLLPDSVKISEQISIESDMLTIYHHDT